MQNHLELKEIPIKSESPSLASRLLGTFTGGCLGAATGIKRSHQMCKGVTKAYLIGLPLYFIGVAGSALVTAPFHGVKGAVVGATKGFAASVKYPSVVENKQNGTKVQKHLNNLIKKYVHINLLTSLEEEYFSVYLKTQKNVTRLQDEFVKYLAYAQKIKQTPRPLFVLGEVKDFDEFKMFVDQARQQGKPIGCRKKNISLDPPREIKNFLQEVREFLNNYEAFIAEVLKNNKETSIDMTAVRPAPSSDKKIDLRLQSLPPATNPYIELSPSEFQSLFQPPSIVPSAPLAEELLIPTSKCLSEISTNKSSHFRKKVPVEHISAPFQAQIKLVTI